MNKKYFTLLLTFFILAPGAMIEFHFGLGVKTFGRSWGKTMLWRLKLSSWCKTFLTRSIKLLFFSHFQNLFYFLKNSLLFLPTLDYSMCGFILERPLIFIITLKRLL